jgi:hypothetical protein
MNGFVGVLLQLHILNNAADTSTIQLPFEFSSTDGLSQTALLGNTINLEESVVSGFWIST